MRRRTQGKGCRQPSGQHGSETRETATPQAPAAAPRWRLARRCRESEAALINLVSRDGECLANLIQIGNQFNFGQPTTRVTSPRCPRHGRTNHFLDPSSPRAAARRLATAALTQINAMDDLVGLEGRKYPVDRRPRRFHRVALAAVLPGDAPANLKAGPARRRPRPDASDIFAARFLLDGEHAEAMQRPMPGDHRGVAPAAQLACNRLAVGAR